MKVLGRRFYKLRCKRAVSETSKVDTNHTEMVTTDPDFSRETAETVSKKDSAPTKAGTVKASEA